jgi:hypothetical protein
MKNLFYIYSYCDFQVASPYIIFFDSLKRRGRVTVGRAIKALMGWVKRPEVPLLQVIYGR